MSRLCTSGSSFGTLKEAIVVTRFAWPCPDGISVSEPGRVVMRCVLGVMWLHRLVETFATFSF